MQTQRLTWFCGPAAVANALECLDIHVDQEDIDLVCHVTKKGTDEQEIMRALLHFGAKVDPWNSRARKRSMMWLQNHVLYRGPAILCVDNYKHWTTVVGALDQTKFWEFDPASGRGWKLHDWDSLATKWRYAKKTARNYFGIGVCL